MTTLSTVDSKQEFDSAIIVGILLPKEDAGQLEEDLNELESLLVTLGIRTTERIVQRRQKLTPDCLLGSGKVEEISAEAKKNDVKLIVFDRTISAQQIRNLEELTGCAILDRTGVILEIFAKNARTNAAKNQVEIARLEYLLPRLSGAWTHLSRQTAHTMARGMGEKQIEIDRRRAREKIARLKKNLEQIVVERETQRKSRRHELKIALVGYTNSGKTTIMNALTKAQFLAKDALFATLDANVRSLDPTTRPKILISDTVGFIRNLPHSLIASFRSTLEEVLEADLLLHVVDLAHSNYKAQMEITEGVLEEIGAGDIPAIMVFNKIDQLDEPNLSRILTRAYKNSICLSAFAEEDILKLRKHIYKYFENNFLRAKLAVKPTDQATLSKIYRCCLILEVDYSQEDIAIFDVQATDMVLAKLKKYVLETEPIVKKETKTRKKRIIKKGTSD